MPLNVFRFLSTSDIHEMKRKRLFSSHVHTTLCKWQLMISTSLTNESTNSAWSWSISWVVQGHRSYINVPGENEQTGVTLKNVTYVRQSHLQNVKHTKHVHGCMGCESHLPKCDVQSVHQSHLKRDIRLSLSLTDNIQVNADSQHGSRTRRQPLISHIWWYIHLSHACVVSPDSVHWKQ